MFMRLNKSLSGILLRLMRGDSVPGSALDSQWLGKLQFEGRVTVVCHGSRRSVKAIDQERLVGYLQRELDLPGRDAVWTLLESEDVRERSELVHLTGDSKYAGTRSMFGFLVNCYEPVPCFLNGHLLSVFPPEGTFTIPPLPVTRLKASRTSALVSAAQPSIPVSLKARTNSRSPII